MASRYWVSPNTVTQFSVAAQETLPSGLFFKSDGTKMYVTGSSGDDVNEYDLSSAWDITTASYLQNFSVASQEGTPTGVFFKTDGTKMYILGSSGDDVNEYDLSSAWDISTASYVQNFSVAAQETQPSGLFFKSDGTKMYFVGEANDRVYEYNLSSAWDISTASFLQFFSVTTQETAPRGLFFKPDGTKMYVIGYGGDDVNEYNLSSAWDISTASYVQVYSVSAQDTDPIAVSFKDDGTKMYVMGQSNDSVFQYPVSTPWNISTITPDTWNGTAGSKWASTSGGAGGETVPTTADDVFFDSNSAGIVTIVAGNTGAKSINCTGFTGTIAGTVAITVAGSVTLDAGQSYTHTGTVTITGTGTLITAGKNFSTTTINGAGITVTLGDALNLVSRTLTVLQGTFDTAGYNVTSGTFSATGTSTRSVIFNASTVTVSQTTAINFLTSTNLTFNAGTSQINATNLSATINGGSQTFYNISFTSESAGSRSITGANTFNNLTLNAGALALSQLSIAADQTVSGTLTCAGTSVIQRAFVRSDTIGTTRTITAAAVSATDCDFRDITIAGAASPISPTRAGDCGNNSGITFPVAKNCYRVGTGTSNSSWQETQWSDTSGGTPNVVFFPLAQDTAIINNDLVFTGALAIGAFNIGSIECSARTTGITLNFNSQATYYGSLTLGSGVTVSSTAVQTFSGRGTQTFTSAGKTITFPLTVDKPAGAFELGDAFTSSNLITHTRGTFDAKTYNLTCATFSSTVGNVRTINMGSGLWTLSGTGTVWTTSVITNLTLNKGTADILLSNTTTTARRFIGGVGILYNKFTIGGATVTSTLTLDNGTFTELASTKTVAHTIRINTNFLAVDTWSVTGTSGNLVTVDSSVSGARRTVTLTNSTAGLIDYLSVKDIGIASPNLFYVGDNSIDGGNNLNVYFTSTPALDTGNMFFMFN
jgi:sugar lactone lactonase YvrE